MNPRVFIIFSLLLIRLIISTANQWVAVEGVRDGDDNGAVNKCFDEERHALLHFKSGLQDPNGSLSTWRDDELDCCRWRGVTCNNQTGRVTNLELWSYGLIGEISDSLLNLSYLNRLDLYNNSFHGTIPTSIGSLTKLRYIDLSYNSLYGNIPPELGNLTNLQVLDLGYVGRCRVKTLKWLSHLSHLENLVMDGTSLAKENHWVNIILSLQKLSILRLDGCELSEVMYPYSSSLNSSSSIRYIHLQNNSLTSSMYRWLFPLTSNSLLFLDISRNMLDGIPNYLGNLCSLESLYIYYNSVVVYFPDNLNNLTGCASLTLQRLYASRSRFTGSLPDDIQKFSSLIELDLSDNQLSSCTLGEPCFPGWIQTLKNTRLEIANTSISDTIPMECWHMWPSQLIYLNLSFNSFSGKVPDLSSNFGNDSLIDLSSNSFHCPITNVSSTLRSLNLSKNKFYGDMSFLCHMVDGFLEYLDLSDNFLTGKLPDCLWHFKELRVLNLGNNSLFGRLPASFGSLIKLEALYLYKNNFSGELPLSLQTCTTLKSLNLGANKFSGNVPAWIGERLFGLYVLILRSNNFFGTIPLQLCKLENLQILDLSRNHLRGAIPLCLCNLTSMVQGGFLQPQNEHFFSYPRTYFWSSRSSYFDYAVMQWQGVEREFIRSNLVLLKSIDLSSNNLTGQIPHDLTKLIELVALNLSKNTLYGEIPQKNGQMKKLLTLDLSRNTLSGPIPSSMSQMTLLNDLDVSFNVLSGRIPSSTQLQSFAPSRYDGNAGLCGPPLAKKCNGDEELEVPSVVGEGEGDGEGINELERWFYAGGVTGFATGFWIACGSLLVNRRGRRAFFHFYDSFKMWVM